MHFGYIKPAYLKISAKKSRIACQERLSAAALYFAPAWFSASTSGIGEGVDGVAVSDDLVIDVVVA